MYSLLCNKIAIQYSKRSPYHERKRRSSTGTLLIDEMRKVRERNVGYLPVSSNAEDNCRLSSAVEEIGS